MSRPGHPHFSQLERRLEAAAPGPRRSHTRTPLARPKDEPGVLWDSFREEAPPG